MATDIEKLLEKQAALQERIKNAKAAEVKAKEKAFQTTAKKLNLMRFTEAQLGEMAADFERKYSGSGAPAVSNKPAAAGA